MADTFYVFGEDLATGLVGPFTTIQAAWDHVGFCARRGDADPGRVVTAAEAEALRPVGVELSPEQDRALVFP